MSDVRMDFVLIEGSQPIGSLHMTNVTVLLFLQKGNKENGCLFLINIIVCPFISLKRHDTIKRYSRDILILFLKFLSKELDFYKESHDIAALKNKNNQCFDMPFSHNC